MTSLHKTVLHSRHVALGAKMVEFGGWDMPIQYSGGIVAEHLATRRGAGLFDVSHMGRFVFRGAGTIDFLQHVLVSNAAALDAGEAQYTIIPNDDGGAVDDAYLYRFIEDEYLLVVNAANRTKDWEHFQKYLPKFQNVEMVDRSEELAMISLQGPTSKEILTGLIESGRLPKPKRNSLSIVRVAGCDCMLARTGYTGEPLCFELFAPADNAPALWDSLIDAGAQPVGLGARDTLRLEAALPLYGHEMGIDAEGKDIPIFASGLAKFTVSFSPLKGDYVGKAPLAKQREAFERISFGDFSDCSALPRMIRCVVIEGKGVARAGARVFGPDGKNVVGHITSGTALPYWQTEGKGLTKKLTDEKSIRAICLALVDSNLGEGDRVGVEIRNTPVPATIVLYHLRGEAPPYARPIVHGQDQRKAAQAFGPDKIAKLLEEAADNTAWRQNKCINLIPSEQTPSPMVRLLSVMDPAFRYAEHKTVKALPDAEVFYYQGTDFIGRVEELLQAEMSEFLGCSQVETRPVSGQMANTIVFSAMVDYLNRANRKAEAMRMRKVMNNDIIKGGHLSSQPMGALRDFVARDPRTEKPAVVNFPVMADDPYKIDVPEACRLIDEHRPQLIILGKSMVLYPEPVSEMRACVDDLGIDTIIMYDMAHVLGLVGPHFQQPFADGASLVTGSTHKTFFGPQRGIVGGQFTEKTTQYELWEAIERRTFPGAVSNHHLGTMLSLLMATYEMNHFKDEYQQAVLANAKAFAKALKDLGMDVAGDPGVSFTQTHQVIINVGYHHGPEIARRLEENSIIVNYQAAPTEEGFSAAGSLRTGVSEMTRFGMEAKDFETVAQLIHDVVVDGANVTDKAQALRGNFLNMKFCFSDDQYEGAVQKLHSLI